MDKTPDQICHSCALVGTIKIDRTCHLCPSAAGIPRQCICLRDTLFWCLGCEIEMFIFFIRFLKMWHFRLGYKSGCRWHNLSQNPGHSTPEAWGHLWVAVTWDTCENWKLQWLASREIPVPNTLLLVCRLCYELCPHMAGVLSVKTWEHAGEYDLCTMLSDD